MTTNRKKSDKTGLIVFVLVTLLLMARIIPLAALVIAYYLYEPLEKEMNGVAAFFLSIILGFVFSIMGMVAIAALIGM